MHTQDRSKTGTRQEQDRGKYIPYTNCLRVNFDDDVELHDGGHSHMVILVLGVWGSQMPKTSAKYPSLISSSTTKALATSSPSIEQLTLDAFHELCSQNVHACSLQNHRMGSLEKLILCLTTSHSNATYVHSSKTKTSTSSPPSTTTLTLFTGPRSVADALYSMKNHRTFTTKP